MFFNLLHVFSSRPDVYRYTVLVVDLTYIVKLIKLY